MFEQWIGCLCWLCVFFYIPLGNPAEEKSQWEAISIKMIINNCKHLKNPSHHYMQLWAFPDIFHGAYILITDLRYYSIVHLFPWTNILDEDMNLSDSFRVPDPKTGQMRRLISQISPKGNTYLLPAVPYLCYFFMHSIVFVTKFGRLQTSCSRFTFTLTSVHNESLLISNVAEFMNKEWYSQSFFFIHWRHIPPLTVQVHKYFYIGLLDYLEHL